MFAPLQARTGGYVASLQPTRRERHWRLSAEDEAYVAGQFRGGLSFSQREPEDHVVIGQEHRRQMRIANALQQLTTPVDVRTFAARWFQGDAAGPPSAREARRAVPEPVPPTHPPPLDELTASGHATLRTTAGAGRRRDRHMHRVPSVKELTGTFGAPAPLPVPARPPSRPRSREAPGGSGGMTTSSGGATTTRQRRVRPVHEDRVRAAVEHLATKPPSTKEKRRSNKNSPSSTKVANEGSPREHKFSPQLPPPSTLSDDPDTHMSSTGARGIFQQGVIPFSSIHDHSLGWRQCEVCRREGLTQQPTTGSGSGSGSGGGGGGSGGGSGSGGLAGGAFAEDILDSSSSESHRPAARQGFRVTFPANRERPLPGRSDSAQGTSDIPTAPSDPSISIMTSTSANTLAEGERRERPRRRPHTRGDPLTAPEALVSIAQSDTSQLSQTVKSVITGVVPRQRARGPSKNPRIIMKVTDTVFPRAPNVWSFDAAPPPVRIKRTRSQRSLNGAGQQESTTVQLTGNESVREQANLMRAASLASLNAGPATGLTPLVIDPRPGAALPVAGQAPLPPSPGRELSDDERLAESSSSDDGRYDVIKMTDRAAGSRVDLVTHKALTGRERELVKFYVIQLRDLNKVLRCEAAHELAEVGKPVKHSVDALKRALNDRDPDVCFEAAKALCELHMPSMSVSNTLLRFLEPDVEDDRKIAAVEALTSSQQLNGHTVNALLRFLRNNTTSSRAGLRAAIAVAGWGGPSLRDARLISVLESHLDEGGKPAQILQAARALVAMGSRPRKVMTALNALLTGGTWTTRLECIELLGTISSASRTYDEDVTAALLTIIWDDGHTEVRRAAARALDKLGLLDRAVSLLVQRLQSPDEHVRESAVEAYTIFGVRGNPALHFLYDRIEDDSPMVRAQVCRVVGELDIQDPKIVVAVKRALRDQDPAVKASAEWALQKMGVPHVVPLRLTDVLKVEAEAARARSARA